jgi:hypothetical protein
MRMIGGMNRYLDECHNFAVLVDAVIESLGNGLILVTSRQDFRT